MIALSLEKPVEEVQRSLDNAGCKVSTDVIIKARRNKEIKNLRTASQLRDEALRKKEIEILHNRIKELE